MDIYMLVEIRTYERSLIILLSSLDCIIIINIITNEWMKEIKFYERTNEAYINYTLLITNNP